LLADLHDDEGRIAVEGFYDDVLDWDDETRAKLRELPFDDGDFAASIDAPALSGEKGYTTLERLWIRPTCDVNGFLSGYTGEGAKTVLPAKAMAKVSFRLVPDQDPKKVAGLVRAHLAKHTPAGLEVEVEELHGGHPWRANPEGWVFEAAGRAIQTSFGREPVLVGEGGSIPIVVDFERVLEAPALLVGFALPGCNMHAPNEWLSLDNFETGIGTLAALYQELADAYPGD
ncbi:MAG TPA: M20/M25/M40 family metallo-hydrolase, partial [Longimicrobiales bacterium]